MLICLDTKKRRQATFSVRKKTVINRGQGIEKEAKKMGTGSVFPEYPHFLVRCQGKMGPGPIFFTFSSKLR
jgi:hypothetical protein